MQRASRGCMAKPGGKGEHSHPVWPLCLCKGQFWGKAGSKGHYDDSHVPIHVCEVRIVAQS